MAELERESLAKLAELETELGALKVEYADALEARRLVEEELTALKRQRQDSARRQSVLENKIIELETLTGTLTKGSSGRRQFIVTTSLRRSIATRSSSVFYLMCLSMLLVTHLSATVTLRDSLYLVLKHTSVTYSSTDRRDTLRSKRRRRK